MCTFVHFLDSSDDVSKLDDLEILTRLWGEYCVPILAQMVQERVSGIIRNPVAQDQVLAQEFRKGECVGLEVASGLPETLYEQAKIAAEKGDTENG